MFEPGLLDPRIFVLELDPDDPELEVPVPDLFKPKLVELRLGFDPVDVVLLYGFEEELDELEELEELEELDELDPPRFSLFHCELV